MGVLSEILNERFFSRIIEIQKVFILLLYLIFDIKTYQQVYFSTMRRRKQQENEHSHSNYYRLKIAYNLFLIKI